MIVGGAVQLEIGVGCRDGKDWKDELKKKERKESQHPWKAQKSWEGSSSGGK